MRTFLTTRGVWLLLVIAMLGAACAADDTEDTGDLTATDPLDTATVEATDPATETTPTETEAVGTETEAMGTETETAGTEADTATAAQACDEDAIVEAVESGPQEGTLEGMAADPVGTAAANNPVLTTLATAVEAAGLTDTLNSAESLTVFAPTDCAFSELDPEVLKAALADPQGLLADVLTFHVIEGEQVAEADLSGEYTTVNGETLTVEDGMVAGQAEIVVGDIETANATVHLIDAVLLPPSVQMDGGTGTATETATEGDSGTGTGTGTEADATEDS